MKYLFFCFIIGSALILTACGESDTVKTDDNQEQASENSSSLIRRIEDSRNEKALDAQERTAALELRLTPDESENIRVEIWLKNPDQKPITSVRSFLTYDPDVLAGSEILIPQDSLFTIVAPGEQEFDALRGIAKIGISSAENKVVTDSEILVATALFTSKQKTFTTIDFYNPGNTGHTLVLAKTADGFHDILQTPSIPTLLFLEQQ